MDDGPRIGGLEALLLIIGGTAAYVAISAGVWGAAPVAVAAFVIEPASTSSWVAT